MWAEKWGGAGRCSSKSQIAGNRWGLAILGLQCEGINQTVFNKLAENPAWGSCHPTKEGFFLHREDTEYDG